MKKSDLEARRQQLNSVSSDTENDFDEIVSSARSPNDTAKITVIPLEKLVEYSDDAFEGITGRPQPFKAHSQESLESLAKSIKENGVIQRNFTILHVVLQAELLQRTMLKVMKAGTL